MSGPSLMGVAAHFVRRVRAKHGDGIEAFMVVARAFADALPRHAAEPEAATPPCGTRKAGGGRAKKRRVTAKPAAAPIELAPEKEIPHEAAPPAPAPTTSAEPSAKLDGVTVLIELNRESITFNGQQALLSARAACFLKGLAETAPAPVSRRDLARRIWKDAEPPKFADTVLGELATGLRARLAKIGLHIDTVHGKGFALRATEPESKES